MTLQSHSRAYIQRKTWCKRIHAPQCSLQHCLQQPRYGSNLMSIDRWMNKDVLHMYNGILPSHWKERNNTICCNVDGLWECHTEWSKSDREGETSYAIPYMWNLKRNDTNVLTKQKETHRLRKWTYGCWGKGIVREFGKLYSKWITNKHMELCSKVCASLEGKGICRRMDIYIHGWVPSLFTWNYHNIINWLYPNSKLKV